MHRFSKISPLLAILTLFGLAGCFESATPLLTDEDASTPFPSIYMAEINSAGQFVFGEKHAVQASLYNPEGKHYRSTDGIPTLMTLVDLGQQVYLIQEVLVAGSDPKAASAVYDIGKIDGSTLTIYAPPDAGKTALDADFASAGVSVTAKNGDFWFDDKPQLLKAAGVFAAHLYLGSHEVYEIATAPADIAGLQQKVAQAEAAAAQPSPAAPAPQVAINDPGADAPNSCDQQAAHPDDPHRMAQGVQMRAIVPALAVQECQKAVAQFPHTARFLYQLGRAEEASNDVQSAVADYQKAADMGYGMAWLNLGYAYEGDGSIPANYQAAATSFRNAIAAGIDAHSELQELIFDPSGYSSPQFFSAMFDGRLSDINAGSASVYLGEFMQLFHNTPDCQDVVSDYAMGHLLMGEEFGALGQMFAGLAQAHSGGDNGDFGQDAQQGWNAGMATTNGLLVQVSDARADAQLFYNREGCDSPVSRQFFHNVESFAGHS